MGLARELMDRGTAAVFNQDFEVLRDVWAPDVVITAPDVGTLHGIDAAIDWIKLFAASLPDMSYQMTRKLEAGDVAIDQGEVIGTNTGPVAMPDGSMLEPTGKQVRLRSLDVATVEGRRITRHDFYFDQLDFLVQLGLMEEPAAHEA